MKTLRILRTTLYYTSHKNNNNNTNSSTIFRALFCAQPLAPKSQPLELESDSVFDSSHYEIPTSQGNDSKPKPTWDEKYKGRADKLIFGEEGGPNGKLNLKTKKMREEEGLLLRLYYKLHLIVRKRMKMMKKVLVL